MRKFICSICGYIYDEAKGIPGAGIAPGTLWEQLPGDWVCPLCGASKSEFKEEGAAKPAPKPVAAVVTTGGETERSALEMSALCSNLARGCEKQYLAKEASLFTQLAEYFKSAAAPAEGASYGELLRLVEENLDNGFPAANAAAKDPQDRGALRALVWGEKVSRILKSLLGRYEAEGEAMLENTSVYVCTICGFIYIGDDLPAICPVCKVPNWKFEKIEGRS